MFSWSTSKKILYILITLLFFGLILSGPIYFKFYKKAPTCSDGIANQDEKGVDCGGVCVALCPGEASELITLYQRYLKVSDGVYNVVALVENNNLGLYAERVPYIVKLYDQDNVLLNEAIGETFVPASKTFPIIEYGITTSAREVSKVTFEFLGNVNWKRGVFPDPKVEVVSKKIEMDGSKPRLFTVIKNNEVYKVESIPVVALIYDRQNNLIASSHTFIEVIPGQSEVETVFTWKEKFKGDAIRIDVIPRLIPRELVK